MFGRDDERAQIERVLDAVADGPVGVALEGAPGIGKTTLWREAIASARRRDYLVLVTAPGEPDAALAFAGLGDLFDGVADEVSSDLPRPQRVALAAALSLDGSSSVPADGSALPRAILTSIRRLAARGPVVLAIDDEQWLDPASARVLAFALCRLREEAVCVLLTRRADSNGALWPELSRNFGSGGLGTLKVLALDLPSIEALLRAQLGRTIPRPVLRRVHAASGGNPLYALAIARALDQSQAGVSELAIPRTLSEAMRQRLRSVDEQASDPMLVVAAASHATLAVLEAVLPSFTLADLDSAVRAEVIEFADERVRFTHPLLASTHYASARADRRRALHRVLANVLSDEEECARHTALGAEGPDRQIALALEQAAATAAGRGAPDSAALLLEDAVRLTPIELTEARWSRVIAAAEQHRTSGNDGRARELLERLIPELPAGPTRARALFQLAPTREDDWRAMEAMLEQALAEVGDNHRIRAQVEWSMSAALNNRGKFDAMVEHADAAVEAAERSGDPGLLAQTLSMHATSAWFAGRGIELEVARRAVELDEFGPMTTYYSPSGQLAQILFWSDDYEAARPALERAIQRADDRGEGYDAGSLRFELAVLEWYAGNRDVSERLYGAADALMREQGEPSLDVWLAYGEALLAAGRGELERAREVARGGLALAEQIGDVLASSLPATVLASVELGMGHPEAAHELLHELRESFLASGFGFMGSLSLSQWSCDIEALIALDRIDDAQPVLDDLRWRARASTNPNAIAIGERCRGRLLAAGGDVTAAIDAVEDALAEHQRRPVGSEIARTLLELGTLQRRAKQKNAAKQTLERALTMFEAMGAQMWVDRTRDELSRIGLRRATVSEGLTPAQMRVAELVVEGMSNREIAGTLYMSPRSVEAHLTKIYREYGVRSRAQLVAALSAAPGSASEGQVSPTGARSS